MNDDLTIRYTTLDGRQRKEKYTPIAGSTHWNKTVYEKNEDGEWEFEPVYNEEGEWEIRVHNIPDGKAYLKWGVGGHSLYNDYTQTVEIELGDECEVTSE